MPDPYRRLIPGEKFRPSARAWNAMLDAAEAHKRRLHDQGAGVPPVVRQGDIVRIKNETGRVLNRFDIVGLDQPIFLPTQSLDAFKREVTFRGTIPEKKHRGKFAILLDPLDVGKVGRAYVDGVVQALVDVKDPSHSCCDVTEGSTTTLESMRSGGSAEILWYELQDESEKTGEQWAIVRVGTNCRVCCTSSSSSSSSSSSHHECPTRECHVACGPIPVTCAIEVTLDGFSSGDITHCGCLDGAYFTQHVSGCTWFAPQCFQTPNFVNTTCTLSWTGSNWLIEAVCENGDFATLTPNYDYDCQTSGGLTLLSTSCPIAGAGSITL